MQPQPSTPAAAIDRQNGSTVPAVTPRQRPRKPNYGQIHAKSLPLSVTPLPAFLPHNPISLLRIAYALLNTIISPSQSHPVEPYLGIFSPETSSVHVANTKHARALWEAGFFGKGTLSRSEPSWLDREKARVKAGVGGTSEEATMRRREERLLFKFERARAEREQIDLQLQKERQSQEHEAQSMASSTASSLSHVFPWLHVDETTLSATTRSPASELDLKDDATTTAMEQRSEKPAAISSPAKPGAIDLPEEISKLQEAIVDQEHLQLTPEEAFFLSYGLGVLNIQQSKKRTQVLSTWSQFETYQMHASFPAYNTITYRADNQFLLNYAVYHHYRSLGWVIRPGSKFSVDYLLYVRGPVFSHAEFAIMIIPEYSSDHDPATARARRDWWWLHCVNRVQTQVRKSLVLCYVSVPTDADLQAAMNTRDISTVLKLYEVRDFVLKRWSANRSRD